MDIVLLSDKQTFVGSRVVDRSSGSASGNLAFRATASYACVVKLLCESRDTM